MRIRVEKEIDAAHLKDISLLFLYRASHFSLKHHTLGTQLFHCHISLQNFSVPSLLLRLSNPKWKPVDATFLFKHKYIRLRIVELRSSFVKKLDKLRFRETATKQFETLMNFC